MAEQAANETIGPCMTCLWDESLYKPPAQGPFRGYYIFGGASGAVLGLWLCFSIVISQHRYNKHYQRLLYYCLSASIRHGVPSAVMHFNIQCLEKCPQEDAYSCKLFAFLDNLLGMYELEILTHLCIERFIDAWYMYKGWSVPRWHHKLFVWLSFGLAVLYSVLPMIGLGGYCKDFICHYCSIDSALPDGYIRRLLTLKVFFLRTYKPLFFIMGSIIVACYLHWYKFKNPEAFVMTKAIFAMAATHVVFWLPLVLTKTVIYFYQYFDGDIDPALVIRVYNFGLCCDSMIPIFPVFVYLLIDRRILHVMIIVLFWRYDLLEPVAHPKRG